jgi:hypothetical protein
VLPGFVKAEPFEEAKVTETSNIVSLLQQLQKPQPATVGDVIKGQTALKTGGESRAELKFPDLTMTRVGANSLFRFYAGGRDMTLDGGTMLFYSPKGAGGGKVQAGAVTAAVTGSAVLVMNLAPTIKVVCLEHAAVVSGPGFTRKIRQGQVIDQNGKVTNINIALLARSSNLCSGFSTPLPFVLKDYRKTQINLDTNVDQTGQVARRTIQGDQPSPFVTVPTAARGRDAIGGAGVNGDGVGVNGRRGATGASGGTGGGNDVGGGPGGNDVGGGTGVNGGKKGNNGNRRDVQNRGNSAVRLNRGNR